MRERASRSPEVHRRARGLETVEAAELSTARKACSGQNGGGCSISALLPPPTAFTLVELLVVLAIIAILSAVIFPVYQRVAANGKAAACLTNLRQIGVGLNGYLNDNEMKMPTLLIARESRSQDVPVIDNTFDKYLTDKRVFLCPGDDKGIGANTGTSYCWNVALNGQAVASLQFLLVSDSTHIPILSDKEGFHPYLDTKVNFLYADGHVTKDLKIFTVGGGN